MAEAEWLAATDPAPGLEFLREKVSDRKLRLFAVACCRRVWHSLPDERSRNAIEVAERYADGMANREEVLIALYEAKKVNGYMRRVTGIRYQSPKLAAALSLSLNTEHRFLIHVAGNAACLTEENDPDGQEQQIQGAILRDIFGNPFRPVALDPSWLTSTVRAIAAGIYDERAFDRLPILADAFQDAGCDNDDVLNHCRQPGEHVQGCWVVDLLTGRE
ncbi:Uncharacterized protein OS=Sorangium cellulosum (strain So ce56) GN=sce5710 PE=4 SV=1 [Gemmata massiliana]|uniref:SMI1/KNR4 family protein n=1 Tax=Gemmata massiliana TaxID=1210884 RepID=A0A6P2DD97_9BACT|nr:hypothetical protein [Gemmata massiliana]VTR99306.1 Uncharacterized protein OS=Sorangium cellulosum (strain So ce56) GN=sce5710 PE=4 SV=1 [Gemmata massiliana]